MEWVTSLQTLSQQTGDSHPAEAYQDLFLKAQYAHETMGPCWIASQPDPAQFCQQAHDHSFAESHRRICRLSSRRLLFWMLSIIAGRHVRLMCILAQLASRTGALTHEDSQRFDAKAAGVLRIYLRLNKPVMAASSTDELVPMAISRRTLTPVIAIATRVAAPASPPIAGNKPLCQHMHATMVLICKGTRVLQVWRNTNC